MRSNVTGRTRFLMVCAFFFLCSGAAAAAGGTDIFIQLGHQDSIYAAAFSRDGKYLATGSEDRTLKLWDAASGMEVRTFSGHQAEVSAVAVFSEGGLVASGDNSGVIKLWDATTGREFRRMSVKGSLTSLTFSPDGRFLTSVGTDSAMNIWEVPTGNLVKTVKNIRSRPLPGDAFIATVSEFSKFTLLDLSSAKEVGTFAAEKSLYWHMLFSQDGRYGLFADRDFRGKRWVVETFDIHSRTRIASWEVDEEKFFKFAFSPDGHYALAAGKGGLRLWDARQGKELKSLTTSLTSTAVFSPDGRSFLSLGSYTPTLWDLSSGRIVRSFGSRPLSRFDATMVTPDGRWALIKQSVTNGPPAPPALVDMETGAIRRVFKEYTQAGALSSDGKHLLLVGNGKCTLWGIEEDRAIKDFAGSYANFSPDGKYVVEDIRSRELKVWEIATGRQILSHVEPSGKILTARLSADNRTLQVPLPDRIRLIDVRTGKEIRSLSIPNGSPFSRAGSSPDGRYLIALYWDKDSKGHRQSLKVWDLSTGRDVSTHHDVIPAALFAVSPDSRSVLFANDKALALCDLATGRVLRTFAGGRVRPWNVMEFSADGKTVITGDAVGVISLWDVATGRETAVFRGHRSDVMSVHLSPDGRRLVSSARDGTTRVWDVGTTREVAQFARFTDGEWLTVTPEGYFHASPGGSKYLNVRVGRQVYSIDNFYEAFFNPVRVASVLQGKKVEPSADIRQGVLTPPEVRITSPAPQASFRSDTVAVTVLARDTGGGIDEVRLYHNGKAIGENARAVRIVPGRGEVRKTYTVTLTDGLNAFRAVGFSKDRTESNPYELTVMLAAPRKDVSLHVFAVGINRYRNPSLNLNYAEPDSRGIADFFRQKGAGLFRKVVIAGLYNEQATKKGITEGLKRLTDTEPQDAVLIYLAGHGESLAERWYFLPHELAYPERAEEVRAKGISSEEFSGLIRNIRAQKVLVLIDACKSGAMLVAFRGFEDRKALSQLSRSAGVHVIAASMKDQFAAEVKELGHGVFTYTLLEGLKGKASGGGETVTVRKLMGYLEEELPDITKKYRQEAQFPVVDSRGMDFPLVTVK